MLSHNRFATMFSDFARTLLTDVPVQDLLEVVVQHAVDLLPVDGAGVSVLSLNEGPRLVAGSDELAMRCEALQVDLDEGPCRAAYCSEDPVLAPDLAVETRWPRFASQAQDIGVGAAFAFPMRSRDRRIGALDLYCLNGGQSLSEEDQYVARTLADVATVYLLNAQARSARSDFVASVSHELRTPMTSITGYVELLRDSSGGTLTQQQETFLDAIERNSRRATHLASDLLYVAALDEGPRRSTDVVDLVEVVQAAREAMQPVIHGRALTVDFEVPAGPVRVPGVAMDLERAVVNLIGNAIKFTHDGGWVRCTLQHLPPATPTNPARARIEISDNGLGIPLSEQAGLFDRFFRSTTAQERQIQGTGLGLHIVQAIVREHHGEIAVDSEHLRGSTFTIDLPMGEQHTCRP